MSKVAIKGATTGTGTFTIESPATNTDRTLVLPDNAGTVLTSASALAAANLSGRVPAANAPLGSVIQVVQAVSSSADKSTTSTSFVSTGTSATITPISATSKILIQYNCHGDPGNAILIGTVFRGGTNLGTGADSALFRQDAQSSGRFLAQEHAIILDSPNTTSAVTYTAHFRSGTGSQARIRDDIILSRFVLMEIAA
jgi:hypothetical protein